MYNKNIVGDYFFLIDSVGFINVYDSSGNLYKKSSQLSGNIWYIIKYNYNNYILSSSLGLFNYNIATNNITTIVLAQNVYGRPRGIFVENTCILVGKQKLTGTSFAPLSTVLF